MLDTSISTYSGAAFDFQDPDISSINILDIAHGLSMMCRFNGHVRSFYSVAEHCVLGASKVPEQYRLPFLLHDASEAFIADIVSPAKKLLPEYLHLERRVQCAVAFRFGFVPDLFQRPEIHEADIRMCITERNQLQPLYRPELWVKLDSWAPYDDVFVECWSPAEAEQRFLSLFWELSQ